jgi:hypothetical protein
MDIPLDKKIERSKWSIWIFKLYTCSYFSTVVSLIYYRIVEIPNKVYWSWMDLGFSNIWILDSIIYNSNFPISLHFLYYFYGCVVLFLLKFYGYTILRNIMLA